jgi:hypothetical protein
MADAPAVIGTATVLRCKSDVRFRAVPPETVVIRQAGPEVLVLNAVGGRILELLDGRRPVAGVLDALRAEYDVAPDALERDTLAFLAELLAGEVLEVA